MKLEDITFVIITYNEEENIHRCLSSLPKSSKILVLDSGSTDNTQVISRDFGAEVHERLFDNYAHQRNAAIELSQTKWIFMIDADEVMSDTLKNSIVNISLQNSENTKGYKINRNLVFQGKKMKFGRTSDTILRFFQKDFGRYESPIHEQLILSGATRSLKGVLWHYSYKNLDDYFTKFNKYTHLVAKNNFENGKKCQTTNLWMRFWLEFINRYILRFGFLDGLPGYTYAMISSFYAWTKYSKLDELEKKS